MLSTVNKKLSYRKQIARQLRTQYVETCTVTQDHWKWRHSIDHIRVPISVS